MDNDRLGSGTGQLGAAGEGAPVRLHPLREHCVQKPNPRQPVGRRWASLSVGHHGTVHME